MIKATNSNVPHNDDDDDADNQRNHHAYNEYPTTVASARGNVHILISTVLGSRIGGAISLIYCFGQAVSCALHITGFTETFVQFSALYIQDHIRNQLEGNSTMVSHANQMIEPEEYMPRTLARFLYIHVHTASPSQHAMHSPSDMTIQIIVTQYTYQLVSGLLITVLFVFNVLGVKCLFRLQSILFIMLVLAVGDFTWGLFQTHEDFGEFAHTFQGFRNTDYQSEVSSFWNAQLSLRVKKLVSLISHLSQQKS